MTRISGEDDEMESSAISIELNARDGYGFIYGRAYRGAAAFNINVMPPVPEWTGIFALDGYEPHASDWVLYIDVEAAFVKIIGAREW